MTGGTYILLLDLDQRQTITFGAAGDRTLPDGTYAYIGSAFGPGGLQRVDRHRAVTAQDDPHWHIDHLLVTGGCSIDHAITLPGIDAECTIAQTLPGRRVPGVGASDCGCPTHLVQVADGGAVRDWAANQFNI